MPRDPGRAWTKSFYPGTGPGLKIEGHPGARPGAGQRFQPLSGPGHKFQSRTDLWYTPGPSQVFWHNPYKQIAVALHYCDENLALSCENVDYNRLYKVKFVNLPSGIMKSA